MLGDRFCKSYTIPVWQTSFTFRVLGKVVGATSVAKFARALFY